MKIVCLSDLHGYLPTIPSCDLVLMAGDYAPYFDLVSQSQWFDTYFRRWLEKSPAPVVGIAGNHDRIFQMATDKIPDDLPWEYIEDETIHVGGFNIYGSPWQLPFGVGWAFNATEEELEKKYRSIPEDTDIVISHGPPFGYGDVVDRNSTHVGSTSLLERIKLIKPKLVLFGHIHEGWGLYEADGIRLANVSLMGKDLEREPMLLEVS